MPFENRLHPLSFLFDVGGQLKQLIVPGIVLLVGAGSAGFDWQAWLLVLVVPSAAIAIVRCLTFRYRFDESELVIRSGLIFRNERRVPYSRIQNIDAVQNLFHRLLNVVEVRVETGGGDTPEASLRVLPRAALDEMRERVFAGRGGAPVAAAEGEPGRAEEAPQILLRLGPRDLLLAGFVESRGLIIMLAGFGVLWEAGLFDPIFDKIAGEDVDERGVIRLSLRAVTGGGMPSVEHIALAIGAFILLLLVMRVLSMIWSLVRLYGFRLERRGGDLRAEYGFFTRVMMTVPLHRIQTLTVREGPLHRVFKTVMVRVDSAGSESTGERGAAKRESLAPILDKRTLPALLREVLPEVDLSTLEWRPVDPRGFGRALRVALVFYGLLALPFVLMLKWWTLALLAVLWGWAWLDVRLHIRYLGWATVDRAVLFRRGWLLREFSVARFSKIQVVSLGETPFDRRHRMASIDVDTAGTGDLSNRIGISYLARHTADELRQFLSARAAQTSFRW